ncbi:MAG: tetratricopeptide (TPR) repeat protein [Rickettsiales bacterium]|jgi:tetratricopeptide (TPR) repeat protein
MIKIKTISYSLIFIFFFSALSSAEDIKAANSLESQSKDQELLESLKKLLEGSQQKNTVKTLDSTKEDSPVISVKKTTSTNSTDGQLIVTDSQPKTKNTQQLKPDPDIIIKQVEPQKITNQNVDIQNSKQNQLTNEKPIQKSVSTLEAIDQIQKSLIFSGNVKPKSLVTQKKPSNIINRSSDVTSRVDILVLNPSKKGSKGDRQKEQIAYNASIAGQYEVAIAIYKQILKKDPNNHYASFSLASCYHKLDQYKQAKIIYYDLLKKDWADQETKEQLIGNLLEVIVQESPNEAIYMLDKLIDQNPNSAYIMAGSAMAYDTINKPDQAILLLKRAIHMNPNEETYRFNLAVIFDKIGDYPNAIPQYQSVINKYISSGDLDDSIPIEQIRQRVEFIKNKGRDEK